MAVKSDDAAIPVFIWNDRIWKLGYHAQVQVDAFQRRFGKCALESIRSGMVRYWRKLVRRSLCCYLRKQYGNQWFRTTESAHEVAAGRDCIQRTTEADWWEWRGGSSLLFWRWPSYARSLALHGHPPWFISNPPQYKVPQRPEPDPVQCEKIRSKLDAPISKRYITAGTVCSLTSYFSVPKGESDLQLVYDATKSGLNSSLWMPNFQLPSSETLTDLLSLTSWMGDLDIGEHFHNFPLHERLQVYCGIDVRPYYNTATQKQGKTMWLCWAQCMMGLRPSPYNTIQSTHLAYEVANGCRWDSKNALQWNRVVLNLPGDSQYNPVHPWVYWLRSDHHMAGATPANVDDLRPVGYSEEHCFAVAHQTASRLCYLGIQNASRKTRPPSQEPGAWAGILARVSQDHITVCTAQEKWDKAKGMLQAIRTEWDTTGVLNHKLLEQRRVFFVHLQRVYPAIAPFLKGIHLTLDGWRPGRDADGWRLHDWDEEVAALGNPSPSVAPVTVQPVTRFEEDLDSLESLFAPTAPPQRIIRSTRIVTCVYGFVDASGAGFGSTLLLPDGQVTYRQGVWGRDADHASSNYRELCNLVETLEHGCATGTLRNSEIFIIQLRKVPFTVEIPLVGSYLN